VLLTSTHIENKKALGIETIEMKAPSVYAVAPGEACAFIPTSTGEFIEISAIPHQTLVENTTAIDFGEHLSKALAELGLKS
jgi:hypothetical protein